MEFWWSSVGFCRVIEGYGLGVGVGDMGGSWAVGDLMRMNLAKLIRFSIDSKGCSDRFNADFIFLRPPSTIFGAYPVFPYLP